MLIRLQSCQSFVHAGKRSIDKSLCCLQFSADKPAKLAAFRSALEPLRQTLKQSKFLGGNKLNYADIAVAGNFLVHTGHRMHVNAGALDACVILLLCVTHSTFAVTCTFDFMRVLCVMALVMLFVLVSYK